mmetsp:Transcript_5941/g.17813  ORF Transcript_5941/g.17813 Transcript_5941/m.17813 type:complete len:325 (+) Transcript_5941:655-1629(+)
MTSRIACAAVLLLAISADAFAPRSARQLQPQSRLLVSSDLEREITDGEATIPLPPSYPNRLMVKGRGIPNRRDKVQLLDTSTYESNLINVWDQDPTRQKGFDWEIEKMRRYFAGLRLREDGTWVRQPSFFEFLVNKQRMASAANSNNGDRPSPVNLIDVALLTFANVASALGFGSAIGLAAVPTAVIQKYEGSFFSFIKGVLGGDLQTLAGGPLFLLLAKYFKDYGPIFNLSFGPKAFLVISDPVMAKHILRVASPDQYCKGMLAEILEPIMGKGLIPADPATWRVSGSVGRARALVDKFSLCCLVDIDSVVGMGGSCLLNARH